MLTMLRKLEKFKNVEIQFICLINRPFRQELELEKNKNWQRYICNILLVFKLPLSVRDVYNRVLLIEAKFLLMISAFKTKITWATKVSGFNIQKWQLTALCHL